MQELFVYQGAQKDYQALQINNNDGTAAVNTYTIGSTLSASAWQGQNQNTLFTLTPTWFTKNGAQTGYDQGQFSVTFTPSNTYNLNPAGEYYLLVSATTNSIVSPVWEGRLKVLATPGFVSPSPPDLISYNYAMAALAQLVLTDSERDFIPYLVTASSTTIRRFCFGRNFDLRTYVEEYDVALDGSIRLFHPPINIVNRVQAQPATALTVWNASTSVQFGQIYFAYTGNYDGYGVNAQVATGVTLNWTSNGVASTQTIPFIAGMMCSDLANAISAVGSGWTATVNTTLGAWPVTELISGYVGQGVVQGQGAQLNVYSTDLTQAQISNQATGILWCGQQYPGIGPKWGPDWLAFDQPLQANGKVKVTYAGGFATIPSPVQIACVELVKAQIYRLRTDMLLKSETAADYSYVLNDYADMAIPKHVQQALAQYRLHYA